MQGKIIKNKKILLNLIKRKESKPKTKENGLVYNNYFTFYKYNNIKEFTKLSLDSKSNDLKEFKDKLELVYHDSIETKPNNEDQKKDLEKRKVVLDTAFELHNKLLNTYKLNMINLKKLKRKG